MLQRLESGFNVYSAPKTKEVAEKRPLCPNTIYIMRFVSNVAENSGTRFRAPTVSTYVIHFCATLAGISQAAARISSSSGSTTVSRSLNANAITRLPNPVKW